jgi:antitoxin (DNA-binding transcriptional repressor) of toxin-antitoxin stability system
MPAVTIKHAQDHLAELIHRLKPGDEVLITEDERPVARLSSPVSDSGTREPRRPGTLRGTVTFMSADFNAPLEDFEEYMG